MNKIIWERDKNTNGIKIKYISEVSKIADELIWKEQIINYTIYNWIDQETKTKHGNSLTEFNQKEINTRVGFGKKIIIVENYKSYDYIFILVPFTLLGGEIQVFGRARSNGANFQLLYHITRLIDKELLHGFGYTIYWDNEQKILLISDITYPKFQGRLFAWNLEDRKLVLLYSNNDHNIVFGYKIEKNNDNKYKITCKYKTVPNNECNIYLTIRKDNRLPFYNVGNS